MTAGGSRDRSRVEVRGLHQHVRRARVNLGGCATHHAGEPDGARVIRDQKVLCAERSRLIVKGGEGLSRDRPADHDAAREFIEVVRVGGLAELKHHVVGDIHRQRDAADTGEPEPGDHPRRGGPGCVDAAHRSSHEDACADPAENRRSIVNGDREPGASHR